MKPVIECIPIQFVVDKTGKKTAVILDIETFQHLMDELEDFYLGIIAQTAKREDEEIIDQN